MPDLNEVKRFSFEMMPISYQALVIELTSVCNAKCAMCYQSSGPKGSDHWGRANLSLAEVSSVINDAITIETLAPRFHLAGGEAFIRQNESLELFSHAREAGFRDISTTTNTFWARSEDKALSMCERLRDAGVTRMEISWDYWHQPYVSAGTVSNALEACAATGINSALRILTTRAHHFQEAVDLLRPASVESATEILNCPVFPVGRAAKEIAADEFYMTNDVSGCCHSTLNLTVNAWGNVYPCCAGADQTEWLKFGNIRENSISEIARYMNTSRLLRFLVFEGPRGFVKILDEKGIITISDQHSNICHLCYEIFSDQKTASAVFEYFDAAERNIAANAFHQLKHRLSQRLPSYLAEQC